SAGCSSDLAIAFGSGAGNGQAAARRAVIRTAPRGTLGLGAAGATRVFQFGFGGRALLRRAGPGAAAIGLAGRRGGHVTDGRHAAAGTAIAGWTRSGTGRTTLAGRTGTAFALARAAGRTLGSRRARRLAGTAGHDAYRGRTRIALAGRHEVLTRLIGFRRGTGSRGRGFLGPAGLFALDPLFFGASRFFADLPAAVVVLDTTRFLGGK